MLFTFIWMCGRVALAGVEVCVYECTQIAFGLLRSIYFHIIMYVMCGERETQFKTINEHF